MNSRQLKFRVWDKLEKRFIYPDKGYQGHFILTLNGKFQNLQNGSGGDEYVVQQWTGFVDAKGVDVYEGDFLEDYRTPITFNNGKFVVAVGGARVFDLEEFFEEFIKPTVKGNIFEHLKLNDVNEYVCNITGIRYRKTVDWDKTFIIKADKKLLEGFPIIWKHLGGCIKMNNKHHQVKNKTFETLEDLKVFVKGLNREIICQIPYEVMYYYDIDKSKPLIKKVSREDCEEVRYLLEYYDVNGD